MQKLIQATAYTFGKNIDTDQIYPGRYLDLHRPEDLALHVMEGADTTFPARFVRGGLIVAGSNFGCGSSREHAPIALQAAGVSLVVAESFARIFYRNALNIGFPLLVCPGVSERVREGDRLTVDLAAGVVMNETRGERYQAEPLSAYALTLLEAGGIKPLMRARLEGGPVAVPEPAAGQRL